MGTARTGPAAESSWREARGEREDRGASDRKRQLADAIISADNSGLAGLTREDLELLLA